MFELSEKFSRWKFVFGMISTNMGLEFLILLLTKSFDKLFSNPCIIIKNCIVFTHLKIKVYKSKILFQILKSLITILNHTINFKKVHFFAKKLEHTFYVRNEGLE
jgi:hypothetical protein